MTEPTEHRPPRRFYLERDVDITGVSGTGRVADGVLWPDGTASVRWRGEHPSAVFWDRGQASVELIHGHGGATRVIWLDHGSAPVDPDAPCPHCDPVHGSPSRCSWAVWVGPGRDGDGQPTTLHVAPTAGQHVAQEDAAWLRQLIRNAH